MADHLKENGERDRKAQPPLGAGYSSIIEGRDVGPERVIGVESGKRKEKNREKSISFERERDPIAVVAPRTDRIEPPARPSLIGWSFFLVRALAITCFTVYPAWRLSRAPRAESEGEG